MADKKTQSPRFFIRDEGDGTVRLRIRLSPELASLIEEAAGTTDLIAWMLETLEEGARRQVEEARSRRPPVGPPEGESDA